MKRLAVLLLSVMLLSACAFTRHGEVLKRRHTIMHFEDAQEKDAVVDDVLTIVRRSSDTIDFKLDTVATNFHVCGLEGTAKRQGPAFEYSDVMDAAPGEERVCLLRITPTDDGYLVEDVGSQCRIGWCGVRASIGRMEFKR